MLFLFGGVIVPIVCFACSANGGNWLVDSMWQSGEFDVYASLMLKADAAWPFYPLLLYSMGSIALFAYRREWAAAQFPIRLGIYGGVALTIQFVLLVYFPFGPGSPLVKLLAAPTLWAVLLLMFSPVAVLFCYLIYGVISFFASVAQNRRPIGNFVPLIGLVLLLLGCTVWRLAISADWVDSLMTFGLVTLLIPILATGPLFASTAFVIAAVEVANSQKPWRWRWPISHLLGVTAWIAIHLGAWRKSMDLAIAAYAQLPTEDPSCYICTAAARGHRRFVGARVVGHGGSGMPLVVNEQLQTLKAAELALRTVSPRFHRRLRRIYDRIGPPLARRLDNPWFADLAYLSLKPAEWAARVALHSLFCISRKKWRRLYAGDGDLAAGTFA